MISDVTIWIVIICLGIGTYLIRYSFLGLIRAERMSPFVQQVLRFTPVAVLPGLVAPMVAWPPATGGNPDPVRLAAAAVALAVGIWTRSFMWAGVSGMAVLIALLQIGAGG
ncbi:AzlD domain-containing protein [Oceanibium sediminis]|uniref:AzlD domain-containing protein n=1 Tax=Oceanibium sediminis TaxID=2026339 RepID=UPI000DD3D3E2|nr:AzlD domain-containing protein [Oceanibium sediminis]